MVTKRQEHRQEQRDRQRDKQGQTDEDKGIDRQWDVTYTQSTIAVISG